MHLLAHMLRNYNLNLVLNALRKETAPINEIIHQEFEDVGVEDDCRR